MKVFNITIVFMIMSIIVVTIISGIYTPSNAQATSVVSNDTTNSQSSGQGAVQLELSPSETIVQSENLQNPSLQDSILNQQQQQQQQQIPDLNSGMQQGNQSNSGSQSDQKNPPPNTGDPFNLCNPYGGPC